MKKLFLLMFTLCLSSNIVSADTLIGTALSEFSSDKPAKMFAFKTEEDYTSASAKIYEKDTIIYGEVTKVVPEKRLKRNAVFYFKPKYYITSKGVKHEFGEQEDIKVAYYKPFNRKQAVKNLSKSGAVMYVGTFIPFFSQGLSFVQGSIIHPTKNENRVVSGVKKVYKDSPLSYVERGKALYIQPGQEIKTSIDLK